MFYCYIVRETRIEAKAKAEAEASGILWINYIVTLPRKHEISSSLTQAVHVPAGVSIEKKEGRKTSPLSSLLNKLYL